LQILYQQTVLVAAVFMMTTGMVAISSQPVNAIKPSGLLGPYHPHPPHPIKGGGDGNGGNE
jgi:hypothetical protein